MSFMYRYHRDLFKKKITYLYFVTNVGYVILLFVNIMTDMSYTYRHNL